ncbi:hypothetical protein Tco_1164654 [Tanacetum coccineum]
MISKKRKVRRRVMWFIVRDILKMAGGNRDDTSTEHFTGPHDLNGLLIEYGVMLFEFDQKLCQLCHPGIEQWPRFKILASFMMPIVRMLARIYTILAPYGTRPRPIFETDMEAIFQEMKEKQEASDKAFEEVRLKSLESDIVDKKSLSLSGKRVVTGKPTKRSRKPSGPILGSTVQIVTIGLTWNDNIADLILSDIVDEQK